MSFNMDEYIPVNERIVKFKEKYPEGSLQTICWNTAEIGDRTFIVYQAAAYRTPDDPRPGNGIAWEPFPGPTQFTRNSELMNAETAAWGRAIVAVGVSADRKLASREEVRNRQAEQEQPPPPPPQKAEEGVLEGIRAGIKGLGWKVGDVRLHLTAVGVQDVSDVKKAVDGLTPGQAEEMWSRIETAVQESRAA